MPLEYLPIAAIVISIGGILFQYFGVIVGIQERIARLETKTELFWKCVEGNVLNILKSYPSNIGKDVLIDKMIHSELTLGEAQTLRMILKEEIKGTANLDWAYTLALGRLEQVIFELMRKKVLELT